MTKKVFSQIKEIFPNVKEKEPLSKHCTFGIGGPADIFIETDDPLKAIKLTKKIKIPYLVLGGGSNILFPDKGFRGAIIKISSKAIKFANNEVTVGAGASLSYLIKESEKKGFYNLSMLGGIPGTVGGAVRGNAGWSDMEISDVIKSAKILDPKTASTRQVSQSLKTLTAKSLKFSYRNSLVKQKNLVVLEATFTLSKAKKYKLLAAKFAKKRINTQPYGMSAGSFFKNPSAQTPVSAQASPPSQASAQIPTPVSTSTSTPDPKNSAGYLIDQCGLKGKKIGGAKISEKHANFIQNIGDKNNPATQKDVLALAKLAKTSVYKRFKIRLEEEVEVVK